MSQGPLSGKIVIDLSQNLPGPFCTRLLQDLGARVIKVEPPKGDPARMMGDFFTELNSGKDLVAINLKAPEGIAILKTLTVKADILVETFRPGVMEKLGIGFSVLEKINPRLIFVSISGLGSEGPLRGLPAHDINLQGMSGFASLGMKHKRAQWSPLPIADFSAAYVALSKILATIYAQETHASSAQKIEVSMFEGLAHMTSLWQKGSPNYEDVTAKIMQSLKHKAGQKRSYQMLATLIPEAGIKKWAQLLLSRGVLFLLPHYGIFRVKNGSVALGIVDEDHFWLEFCEKMGGTLKHFKGFSLGKRIAFGSLIKNIIKVQLRQKEITSFLHEMQVDSSLPVTRVNTPEEAALEPQLKSLGRVYFEKGKHHIISPLAEGAQNRYCGKLGENNLTILQEFGFNQDQINLWQERKIISGKK